MSATNGWEIRTVFEDEDLLAVSKPAGLSVHASHPDSTELTLESLVTEIKGKRLILLHRLDKGTSGLVLFAKKRTAAGEMSRAFEEKRIRKAYVAVVNGVWDKKTTKIESFIFRDEQGQMRSEPREPGKKATTTFRVLLKSAERTLLEAIPKTGRTHQIRLHCAGADHAILGDSRYGGAPVSPTGHALHAYRVDFQHPVSKAAIKLSDPPPEAWSDWLAGFPEMELQLWRKSLVLF